ncbi:unnamed protein product, partial [marine sediment metagenome]
MMKTYLLATILCISLVSYVNSNFYTQAGLINQTPTILEPVPHYKGYSGYNRLVGIAFVTTEVCPEESYGYQSMISTLVGVSTKGKIVGIKILQENESCDYARSLFPQFIQQFINKSLADDFILGKNIDAIT